MLTRLPARHAIALAGIPALWVNDGVVPTVANCVNCGTAVTAATSFMTEHGLLCWTCQTRLQNHQEAVAREVSEREGSLGRRASVNGRTHGLMWGVTVILATHWTRVPSWVGGVGLIGAAGLMFGLAMRARWAFRVALVIDLVGAIALVVAGATLADTGASVFVTLLATFPLVLTALVWTLRGAYVPTAPRGGEEISLR